MSLESLQKKVGVTADGVFGKNTLRAAKQYFCLSDLGAAHFFGQCSHETGGFRLFSENLNYSADALMRVFPKYFNKVSAVQYARLPERIANRVYANRMGNGDEASGDGYRYRGRGALQLTGKSNYKEFADWLGKSIDPDSVADEYAFDSAKYYFDRNRLWTVCHEGISDTVIAVLTRKINGGVHGLDDRKAKTKLYYGWLTE